jgi:RimJ/RimL family protein N-acetyltransferase
MIRMARRDDTDTAETGMWLGTSLRGKGIGVTAVQLLVGEAARVGIRRVVAETTAANVAAIGVLRRCGAVFSVDGTQVHAEISIGETLD